MPEADFIINVAAVMRAGEARPVRRAGLFADLFVTGSAVPPAGEVVADLVLEPVPIGGGLHVTGVVTAPWEGECSRCLATTSGVVQAEVADLFEPEWTEDETWPLVHDRIDLEPLVREAVLVELPQAPLCREDCLGLCQYCGADRNQVTCSCEAPADPRWAALDQLAAAQPRPPADQPVPTKHEEP